LKPHQRNQKKFRDGPTGAGGRGARGRGGLGGGGSVDGADDVVSALPEPSEGSLTDSNRFDSCERQR
jgi:hypothetical protein